MFEIDGFGGQAIFIGDGNGLAFNGVIHDGGAVVELELFGAAEGGFQAVGQVVGDVVASDGQNAGVFDDAVGIDDVFGRAAADVHDQGAEFLLFVGQQGKGRGQAVEDNIVHFELEALDGANGILEPVQAAVDDMDIHLEARAEHAHRIGDVILVIHQEMLADGVNGVVLGGEIDGLGVLDDILHVFFGDLAVGREDGMDAAIVEAAHVPAGHPEIHAADFDIGHLLGLGDGVADVLLGQLGVDDFAFANAARAGLAHADDFQGAIGAEVAHHGADFGGADFQANDD